MCSNIPFEDASKNFDQAMVRLGIGKVDKLLAEGSLSLGYCHHGRQDNTWWKCGWTLPDCKKGEMMMCARVSFPSSPSSFFFPLFRSYTTVELTLTYPNFTSASMCPLLLSRWASTCISLPFVSSFVSTTHFCLDRSSQNTSDSPGSITKRSASRHLGEVRALLPAAWTFRSSTRPQLVSSFPCQLFSSVHPTADDGFDSARTLPGSLYAYVLPHRLFPLGPN